MRIFTSYFLVLTFLCASMPANADDIIFGFGSNLSTGTTWKYKGGGSNYDAAIPSWKSAAFVETGWSSLIRSAFGFGSGPVKNTVIPETTAALGGGTSTARYPTMYFRKAVTIVDPTDYINFKINAQFDDGIVVWVNGQEAYRNNVTANPTYADWATTAIPNNGTDVYTGTISSFLFLPGNNVIAVEIHQSAVNSSDLFFDMELIGVTAPPAPVLLRGPYLQVGTKDSITIRWRTDIACNSTVRWGTIFGVYPNSLTDAKDTIDHVLRIGTLSADTKYFYTIGTSTFTLQAGLDNNFLSLPPDNTTRKLRFLAIGDCGNSSTNQKNSRDAFINYIGSNNVDGMILLGDNAYNTGTDAEYQTNFFNIYKDNFLKYYKLYPAPGNHDYGNTSTNTGSRNMPYHKNFSVPMAGEIGGVPSGVQNYYSYNIGDVHFISLDSYGKDNANTTKMYDTLGAQATWLKADLAANNKRWTVAYFHHPPYTKTSHDSDAETDLQAIREKFIRILERNGVDLIVCGHSHGYERSYLLKNYFSASGLVNTLDNDFNATNHTATGNLQNAIYDASANSCAFTYNSGRYNHGSVYVVSGSAGQLPGTTLSGYPLGCMHYSNVANGGVFYFEVDSNRLDAKFISYVAAGNTTPVVRDQFTVFKDVNKTTNIVVNQFDPLQLTASWRGAYKWAVSGNPLTRIFNPSTAVIGTTTYTVTDDKNCLQDIFNVTVTTLLSVEMTSFAAALDGHQVALNWTVANQHNNKEFIIERSTDGIVFQPLARIAGAGTLATAMNYQCMDSNPAEGANYYRLSQINNSGVTKYLETRKVLYNPPKEFSATVIANGNGKVAINVRNAMPGKVRMKIFDMMGNVVQDRNISISASSATITARLHNGAYVLLLANANGQTFTSKMIVAD